MLVSFTMQKFALKCLVNGQRMGNIPIMEHCNK